MTITQLQIMTIKQEQRDFLATSLLVSLSAFNLLTLQIVHLISESHNVDGLALCKKLGITFFINTLKK